MKNFIGSHNILYPAVSRSKENKRDYSKNTGLLQAARASCKVWRVW